MALADVSLAIPEGSICGLLGRNGAGKTTIMSIIAGQDRPTSGRVSVLGDHPFENEAVASKISFVRDNQRYPDNYRLHHVLRIAPAFAGEWNQDVADELVEGFRIPSKIPLKKFSRGQLSSVAILIALASRAPVTLLDEPYLGLDGTARALFHDVLLRDYVAHPRTIVLSTHLIEESEALFDRVVVVDRGQIRADVAIEETPALAFTLSGNSEDVDLLAEGRVVMQTHSVGGLKSVTIQGEADDAIIDASSRRGARIAPASLEQIVAGFGADPTETPVLEKGARA